MKKSWGFVMILAVFTACNNSAGIENKADSLSKEVDSFGKRVWDSTRKGAEELEKRIRDEFSDKDSASK